MLTNKPMIIVWWSRLCGRQTMWVNPNDPLEVNAYAEGRSPAHYPVPATYQTNIFATLIAMSGDGLVTSIWE